MTPLKKRLDEKREKQAEEFHPENAHYFIAGAAPRDEIITKLGWALEKIINHELYEGVNQGRNSEDIAAEALVAIEKFLG